MAAGMQVVLEDILNWEIRLEDNGEVLTCWQVSTLLSEFRPFQGTLPTMLVCLLLITDCAVV